MELEREVEFQAPETISERIYKVLKKRIIEGELKPNQKIPEKKIAELFNVSATPVREAFQKLAGEKYLIINSRKDVTVRDATFKEIDELFEVLAPLDIIATRKALKKLSIEDIKELREQTKILGNYYKKKDILSYKKQNYKLHAKLRKACGNEFLSDLLIELKEKAIFFSVQMYRDHIFHLDESYKSHLDLMEAIEKRDVKSVIKILRSHWREKWFFSKGK